MLQGMQSIVFKSLKAYIEAKIFQEYALWWIELYSSTLRGEGVQKLQNNVILLLFLGHRDPGSFKIKHQFSNWVVFFLCQTA